MSVFDAEISVLRASIATTSPEAIEAGMDPALELALVAGLMLPVANPATGEPLHIPVGQFRYSFSKEQAIKVFSEALAAAQALPDPRPASGLITASNMAQVEQAAQSMKRVTG